MMVMGYVAESVPQVFVTLYMMVSVPALMPVTFPAVTLAVILLLSHEPPVAVSVSKADEPAHTVADELVILPATGKGVMVIGYNVESLPQVFVTL